MLKKYLLLGLMAVGLAGCATSSSYQTYTVQHFAPKDQYYDVVVYPINQVHPVTNPYYVIGKVTVDGFVSYGVSPESLLRQAKIIARKRGADAIINARTEEFYYYSDELLRFSGELIVYAPAAHP